MTRGDLFFLCLYLLVLSLAIFTAIELVGLWNDTKSKPESQVKPQVYAAGTLPETTTLARQATPTPVPTTTPKPTPTATPTPTPEPVIARVTAYAPFDNKSGMCNDGNPNSTSTGQKPGPTIAAVDPAKIPYGTRFRLEGVDRVFVAGDTGSALRAYDGIAIDIYMDTYEEARRWGVRYLEIEVIE